MNIEIKRYGGYKKKIFTCSYGRNKNGLRVAWGYPLDLVLKLGPF